MEIGQHWFRLWRIAWRHQTITCPIVAHLGGPMTFTRGQLPDNAQDLNPQNECWNKDLNLFPDAAGLSSSEKETVIARLGRGAATNVPRSAILTSGHLVCRVGIQHCHRITPKLILCRAVYVLSTFSISLSSSFVIIIMMMMRWWWWWWWWRWWWLSSAASSSLES